MTTVRIALIMLLTVLRITVPQVQMTPVTVMATTMRTVPTMSTDRTIPTMPTVRVLIMLLTVLRITVPATTPRTVPDRHATDLTRTQRDCPPTSGRFGGAKRVTGNPPGHALA